MFHLDLPENYTPVCSLAPAFIAATEWNNFIERRIEPPIKEILQAERGLGKKWMKFLLSALIVPGFLIYLAFFTGITAIS